MYLLPLVMACVYLASIPLLCVYKAQPIRYFSLVVLIKIAYSCGFITHELFWIFNGFWDDYEFSSIVVWQILSSMPFLILLIDNYLEYKAWLVTQRGL